MLSAAPKVVSSHLENRLPGRLAAAVSRTTLIPLIRAMPDPAARRGPCGGHPGVQPQRHRSVPQVVGRRPSGDLYWAEVSAALLQQTKNVSRCSPRCPSCPAAFRSISAWAGADDDPNCTLVLQLGSPRGRAALGVGCRGGRQCHAGLSLASPGRHAGLPGGGLGPRVATVAGLGRRVEPSRAGPGDGR